jgi:hypothetical protein
MLYTISNDLISLTISSLGAEIKSIKKDGIEYMHQDNLKLVLGQVLLNHQRAGKIYVKYEHKQACFHITVRP